MINKINFFCIDLGNFQEDLVGDQLITNYAKVSKHHIKSHTQILKSCEECFTCLSHPHALIRLLFLCVIGALFSDVKTLLNSGSSTNTLLENKQCFDALFRSRTKTAPIDNTNDG